MCLPRLVTRTFTLRVPDQRSVAGLRVPVTRVERWAGRQATFNLYMAQSKFDQARARVDQAIAGRPTSAPLYFLKAGIYGRLGGLAEAEGNAEQMKQYAQQAEAELRRAVELDPSFVPANDKCGRGAIRALICAVVKCFSRLGT